MQFTEELIKDDNVHIGQYTYGHPHIFLGGRDYHVYIGKFCSIADGVKMIIGGEHRTDWVTTYPFGWQIDDFEKNSGHPAAKGDINIGNDVWIGMGSTILSGVTIGDGAVIGADSVISKDIGDYEIVAGNPARHIRYRFSERQIKDLEKICWWDWPLEKIREFAPLLESSDIDLFIRSAEGESLDGDSQYCPECSLGYECTKRTSGKVI